MFNSCNISNGHKVVIQITTDKEYITIVCNAVTQVKKMTCENG